MYCICTSFLKIPTYLYAFKSILLEIFKLMYPTKYIFKTFQCIVDLLDFKLVNKVGLCLCFLNITNDFRTTYKNAFEITFQTTF